MKCLPLDQPHPIAHIALRWSAIIGRSMILLTFHSSGVGSRDLEQISIVLVIHSVDVLRVLVDRVLK